MLLTQRDALESKFDLLETRMQQFNAQVNVYRALGGGWNQAANNLKCWWEWPGQQPVPCGAPRGGMI